MIKEMIEIDIGEIIANELNGEKVDYKNEDLLPEEYCKLYNIDLDELLKQYKTFLINTL